MGSTHLHRVSGDINQDHVACVTFKLFKVTSNWIAWHLGDGGSGGVETSIEVAHDRSKCDSIGQYIVSILYYRTK